MPDESRSEAELLQENKRLRHRIDELEQAERTQGNRAVAEPEQLLRTIVENAPDGILVVDAASKEFCVANNLICQMLGYSQEELQTLGVADIHPEQDVPYVMEQFRKLIAGESSLARDIRVRRKDRSVFHADISSSPITMAGKTYLMGIFRDVDERSEIRDRNETILRTCSDGFWLIDQDGHILEVNDAYCRMSGYRRDELLTMSVQDVEAVEAAQETIHHIREIMARGAHRFESRQRRKDGTMIDLDISTHPLMSDTGKIFTFLRDVTVQKQAERALRESELRYRTLFETLPSGVGLASLDGRIIDANSTMLRMMGRSLEETRQINLRDTYNDPETRTRLLKQLQHQDVVRDAEVQLKRKDGAIYWASLNIAAMKMRDETVLLTVATDVTERNRVERALAESEEKYRTLVESAGETIATVDKNGVFTFMNTTAAKRLGGTPKDFTGKTMWELFPKEIADRQAATIRKVITTRQGANVIGPTDLHGQLRWYSTTIEPLRDSFGEVTASLIVARDIHELRQAEDQIRNLISAVEQSMDGVATADAKSRLSYVNDAFAHMHGYSRQEMIGMSAADLYSQDQGDRYREAFVQIGKDGSYAGQAWHVRKDGAEFPCYISLTLVKNDRAEGIGTVAVCRDMTEARQKQEELDRYRAQMARAEQLASLGTLSATVAHQITQPLTVIRLLLDNVLDNLEGTSCPEKSVRRLQDSVIQVSNITDIINRFRNFARQSSDTRFGQVNVNVIAERVVRLLEENARQARVTLNAKGMGKLPPVAMNETDLEQLFFALLENAIQAADRTQARRIIISGAVKDDRVELRFSDNCGGIAPEIRDRLFEPFFTTKPRGQGTGLGLCIVHDAVARVGGHIRLESKLGRGTTFFVSLPVHKQKAS